MDKNVTWLIYAFTHVCMHMTYFCPIAQAAVKSNCWYLRQIVLLFFVFASHSLVACPVWHFQGFTSSQSVTHFKKVKEFPRLSSLAADEARLAKGGDGLPKHIYLIITSWSYKALVWLFASVQGKSRWGSKKGHEESLDNLETAGWVEKTAVAVTKADSDPASPLISKTSWWRRCRCQSVEFV